jgi:hypothetical protein
VFAEGHPRFNRLDYTPILRSSNLWRFTGF